MCPRIQWCNKNGALIKLITDEIKDFKSKYLKYFHRSFFQLEPTFIFSEFHIIISFNNTLGNVSSQTESLFHDGAYGVNETFEPEFDPCETFNLTTEALSVCKNATNKACMYDYCVTRNDQIAADTLQQDQTFQQDQLIRGNGVKIKGNRFRNKIVPTKVELKVALRF